MKTKQIGFLWVCIGLLASCRSPTKLPGSILGHLPDTVRAGSKLQLIGLSSPSYALVQSSYENLILDEQQPELDARYAGTYLIDIIDNQKIIEKKTVVVLPASPQNALLLVGAKSIVADGQSTAMAILIPEDAYHNISLQETTFNALRPDQQTETNKQQPYHLMAYQRFTSHTTAGKTLISARIGRLRTTAKEITEVAGKPINYTISAHKVILYADDNQFFTVKTNVLHDKFGNVVEDGTLVDLSLTDVDQQVRQLTAYTLHGIATWQVKNPAQVGPLYLQSQSATALSNRIMLQFADKHQSIVSLEKP